MFKQKIYPYLLAVLQLSSLAFLGLSAPVISKSLSGILLESAGVFLAAHAVYVAGIHNVNITPTPRPGGILITNGPYRVIRHPMYLAQLVAIFPLLTDYFSLLRTMVYLLLVIVLLLKMEYEEKGLVKQFGKDYLHYMQNTRKILPFIY